MSILPKAIYRFNAIPHQNPNTILQRHGKSNSQIPSGKAKQTNKTKQNKTKQNKKQTTNRIAKTILNNKSMAGGNHHPWPQGLLRAIVIKTAWYWYRDSHIDQ